MARHLLDDDEIVQVSETDLELEVEPDKSAVYHLRMIPTQKAREIAKRHTKYVPNRVTHQREERQDDEAIANDMLDYAITKWEHVTNGSNPAPCDLSHKLKLPVAVQTAILKFVQVGRQEEARPASFRQPAPLV